MRPYRKLLQVTRCIALISLVVASLVLSACHRGPPWATKDISGLMPKLTFSMTEAEHGNVVHGQEYRGQVVLVFFGYTHCPDVCPLTLSRIKSALSKLGEQAGQVRVLFVTVDPARDSLQELKHYTGFFGPQFIGLRGDPTALREFTKKYRVSYGYDKPDTKGNYNVSHSNAIYVFDRHGEARLLVRSEDTVAAIARDLQRLLAEN
jgi:protein SCO1/2